MSIEPPRAPRRPWAGAAALLFGFLLTFNFVLPVGANLRTTDALNALCALLFVGDWMIGRRLHPILPWLAGVLLLSLGWVGAEIWHLGDIAVDPAIRVVLGRWLLGIFSAYRLAVLMADPALRGRVALGLLAGTLGGLATVAQDAATFDLTRQMPTLKLEQYAFIYGQYRPAGMFSHPNEAAGAIMLGAPLALGLVEERGLPRIAVLGVLALTAAVLLLTQSRSPPLLGLLLAVLWAWRTMPRLLVAALMLGGAALLIAALLGVSLAPGSGEIGQRLTDQQNVAQDFSDRLATMLDALAIALVHPLGVGSIYEALLARDTAFMATHNAYLQLALMGGLPLAVLTLAMLTRGGAALLHAGSLRIEGWVALYLALLFCTENFFFLSFMPVLTLWLFHRPGRRTAWPVAAPGGMLRA